MSVTPRSGTKSSTTAISPRRTACCDTGAADACSPSPRSIAISQALKRNLRWSRRRADPLPANFREVPCAASQIRICCHTALRKGLLDLLFKMENYSIERARPPINSTGNFHVSPGHRQHGQRTTNVVPAAQDPRPDAEKPAGGGAAGVPPPRARQHLRHV